MEEFSYVSTTDKEWDCVNCNKIVQSEQSGGWQDPKGNPVFIYTPASRYWLAGSKPALTKGVFCSIECSQIHIGIQKAIFANNENPEGL